MDTVVSLTNKALTLFIDVLFRHDPMKLRCDNNFEYEAEALSILSRFNEAALHLSNDDQAVIQVASNIVKQSLEFWFDDVGDLDYAALTRELVDVYNDVMIKGDKSVALDRLKE